MYSILMFALIGIGVWLVIRGAVRRNYAVAAVGILLAAGSVFFFWFMDFWGEMLWFASLGYGTRFWEAAVAKALSTVGGGLVTAALVYLLTGSTSTIKRLIRFAGAALAALMGAGQGAVAWDTILRFIHAAPTELRDPIFDHPVGFFLFHLPFYDILYDLLLTAGWVSVVAAAAIAFLSIDQEQVQLTPQIDEKEAGALYRCAGVLLLVLALGKWLDRYHTMYSELGVANGPGWTDVNLRLPALGLTSFIFVVAGIFLMVPPLRHRAILPLQRRLGRRTEIHLYLLGGTAVILFLFQALALSAVPMAFQRLRVEPNEITFEKPFIGHNIRFTRHGFKLHTVEEREYPASEKFTHSMVEQNPTIFSNIRLWDWRALDAVYKQFQEIRLYYEFQDVDVDRYTVDGDYQQVMVSAREMEIENLPEKSQTFVNRRFKYTHGYGITMTNVSEFTPQGLPDLLIRDIPPKSRYPSLAVERPQIYYGELTNTHVVVNTSEKEFDYPKGEENVYIRYPGTGGVLLKNLWRKFLYGWKFDGVRLFLSEYPGPESRIQFHRQIHERVRLLAPFLEFDDDPYVVLAEGKLFWIIDGYTTSRFYPYSEPFRSEGRVQVTGGPGRAVFSERELSNFEGKNYVRNSVKAVVDAFNGSVTFYVFEPDDPLVRTWTRIFPEMFESREKMPETLERHIRYPADMLLIQGLMYTKYHMTDPTVFYNQEDLWVRATEKYYGSVQPVQPYYIMWELPESDRPEFVLMLPFTPKNRQVLIGWIAGMSDGDNYGRFLAYKFPKEKRVLGPQQVETKIDQDRYLSGQLTLWDQRGSRVIRGNVLAIPVEGTLLYVEPIYLQAETAAYPELRLVALMHNDVLSYAETFDKALEGLLGKRKPAAPLPGREDLPVVSNRRLIRQAGNAFDSYLQALGQKQYEAAASALKELETALQDLEKAFPEGTEEEGQSVEDRETGRLGGAPLERTNEEPSE